MSGYTVLATRYRPRVFKDVVGQEDAARILCAAIAGNRAAHAYLFSGPRGVGKTSMARILAKAWNCLQGESGEPCGTCSVCRAIDESGSCLDVVEIDGASHNKVENVRELIENIRFRPVEARYRIYIVDEVHMLSTSAFNALLKTLEEPPAHAKFILATTEPLKVPETIRSRCQPIDFRRLGVDEMAGRLAAICAQEGVAVPDGLLQRVARQARGGLRDALSQLDQLIAFGAGRPTLADFERLTGRLPPELLHDLLAAALAGDSAAVLRHCSDAFARGARGSDLVEQLTEILQGLLVTVAGGEPSERTAEERAALSRLAPGTNLDQVLAMLDVLVECNRRLRQRHDSRLVVEMALLTLARVPLLQPLSDLLAGRPASAPAPAAPGTAGTARSAPPASRNVPAINPAPASAASARAPAASAPAAPVAGDVRARFVELASQGSRSLRVELQRYRDIRVEGDELLLVPPEEGPAPMFDLQDNELRRRLEEAARAVAGRPLRVRLAGAAGDRGKPSAAPTSRPSAPAAGAPEAPVARSPRAPAGDIERRVLGDWPGSERIDF